MHYNTNETFLDTDLSRQLGAGFVHKDVVFGAYFTGGNHPQHGTRVQAASFDYIAGWLYSAARLGLNVVLFHDGLPQKFMDKVHRLQATQRSRGDAGVLHFVRCQLGPFTVADERFLVLCAFLEQFPCRNAFMVDVSDAWFRKSPFDLIHSRSLWNYFDTNRLLRVRSVAGARAFIACQREHWKKRKSYRLFLGGEVNTIGENKWMLKHFDAVYGERFNDLVDKPVLNCGIIGGSCAEVRSLLQDVRKEFCRLEVTGILNDMAVFNRVLYAAGADAVYTNGVLNSPWKTWAKSGRHCIFHK